MGYAPDSIQYVYDEVHKAVPATQLGGIHGHKPGYHACRAYHEDRGAYGDYSIQKPDDKAGDRNAGAALDITFSNVDDEIRLMKRLMQAGTSGDKRVWNLREYFGTVDGNTVTGYDPRGGYYCTSDDSHLWHIHISWYRKFATDMATARNVADVLLARDSGGGGESGGDDDMVYQVALDKSGGLEIANGTQVDPKWDIEVADNGNIFYGEGEPAEGKGGNRIDLDGAYYVSTFSATVKGLTPDAAIMTTLVYCDLDGNQTGVGPWHKVNGLDGDDYLVDTRAGHSNKGRGIKIRIKAYADVSLASLKWRVVYWK